MARCEIRKAVILEVKPRLPHGSRDRPRDEVAGRLTLAAVIRNHSGKKGVERRQVLEAEPVLGQYVQHEVLKIIGRLALSEAPPGVCRCVVTDMYRILDVAGSALREGYRGLLNEFMPAADADAGSDKPGEHTQEGADAE